MLNLHRLEKQFSAGSYEKLLQGVLDNGLPLSAPLRRRLSQGSAAAIALGLRRVVEMTYGPTALSRAMIDALLSQQTKSGAFTAEGRPDPLATASAVAALALVLADHAAGAEPALEAAHDRAMAALCQMQESDGLFRAEGDRSVVDRARTAAFVLWLLASDAGFRQDIRLPALCQWFESRLSQLEASTAELYRLACLSQPIDRAPAPLMPAIAA